jgi:anaerobic ribonucleoside-triphosphate reductase activating protein
LTPLLRRIDGLRALMKALKQRGQHMTLYTGYTLEELTSRRDARIEEILALTDILIDGPFVKELAENRRMAGLYHPTRHP